MPEAEISHCALLDIARQTADHEVRLLSFYKAIIVDCGGQEDGFMSYP